MRVTNNMMVNRVLYNIKNSAQKLSDYQGRLSSGKSITRPSDDPVGVNTALRLRTGLTESERYVRNIGDSVSWLEATESAMSSAVSVLQRVREQTVYGANGTLPQTSREAIAKEVDQLLEQLVQTGNASYGDRFVFGGHQTLTTPFTLNAGPPKSVAYNGDSGQIIREIGPATTMTINLTGDAVFGTVFDTLIGISDDLRTGNTANLSATRLGELDVAIDRMLTYESEVGAKINRLQYTTDRLEDLKVSFTTLLSDTEDADIAETVVRLKAQENTHRLALEAGAQIIQPTLLDFLGIK